MKIKILFILIILFAAVYWRGTRAILISKGYNCNWRTVYAVCLTDSNKVKNAPMPKFADIMKEGIKFK